MNQNVLSDISKDTFEFYYRALSVEDLADILNNSNNLDNCMGMEIYYIVRIFDKLNDNVKNKFVTDLDVNKLLSLLKNDKISEAVMNNDILEDINHTIRLLIHLILTFN